MDIDADVHGAPSSFERVIVFVERRVPDCDLTVLRRALLISSLGQANDTQEFLVLSLLDLAHQAIQCSAEAEPEWKHVGTLEVTLRRNWLLYETHLADVHLELFSERGPTRPPPTFGRVYVPEVAEILWPAWIRGVSSTASTNTGILEAMPDGLSQPFFPCKQPPCRERFVDVTLRTRLLQSATAVGVVLRYGCAVIAGLIALGVAVSPFVLTFLEIRGIGPSHFFLFLYFVFYSRILYPVLRNYKWLLRTLGIFRDNAAA